MLDYGIPHLVVLALKRLLLWPFPDLINSFLVVCLLKRTSLFELHRPQHLASPSFGAAPFVAPPRNNPLADMRKARGFAVKNEVQPLNLSFLCEV